MINPQSQPGSIQPPSGASPETSGKAIASLVFGILTWVFLPILGGIIAIIVGNLALSDIKKSDGRLSGSGMAKAGIILSVIQLVLILVPVCMLCLLSMLGPAIGNVFSGIILSI